MDNLSLIYETNFINDTTVRSDLMHHILTKEKYGKYNEVDMLLETITPAEEQFLTQEGLFNNLKTRGAQAMGAAKGAYQGMKGKGQQLAGQAANKIGQKGAELSRSFQNNPGDPNEPVDNAWTQKGQQLQQQGQENIDQGSVQGQQAKLQSYVKNTVQSIYNDMNSLGIQLTDPSGKKFWNAMLALFDKHFAPVGDAQKNNFSQQMKMK